VIAFGFLITGAVLPLVFPGDPCAAGGRRKSQSSDRLFRALISSVDRWWIILARWQLR